jgi:hypothetical protein
MILTGHRGPQAAGGLKVLANRFISRVVPSRLTMSL